MRVAIALLLIETVLSTPAFATTLSQGRAAYDQNKVSEAEKIYAQVAANASASASDRAQAQIELARIKWLIDRDAEAALRHVASGKSLAAKACEISEMETRILRESSQPKEAIDRSGALLGSCKDEIKRDRIALELIRANLDLAATDSQERHRWLRDASARLNRLTLDASKSLDAAAARLEIGLLTDDSKVALRGWQDYFWLAGANGPPALATLNPLARFEKGLGANATDEERVGLTYLLIRAGFSDAAKRFAAAKALPGESKNPQWRLVTAYWQQRDALVAAERALNRKIARGGSRDPAKLQGAAMQALQALMAAAGASGDPRDAMLSHYGLIGSVGVTGGFPSLHIGHVVEDRTETVRQYGKEAKVRFQAIDNMWANGFESWLWDGAAAAGGWADNGKIIHVRPEYTSAPFAALALVGDTQARRELRSELPAKEAEDLVKARSGLPATLEGLNDRLRLQIIEQIATEVRKKSPADFRRAFLDEYWQANLEQSIFIHEGRHAIDQAMAPDPAQLEDALLEYQAKLSELALTKYPRMALRNMNTGIGGSTPHNRAGTRIITSITAWLANNSDQVVGFDRATPPQVQLDKLTDAQIREIARSLDPLPSGRLSPAKL